jgi:transcriptional regulator with XRE-family HTH domain
VNYFKTNLKYLRKTLNLKQEEIGSHLNKWRTAISNWEAGLGEPNINELVSLSKLFDIRLDILILVNIEKAKLITDKHILEFAKKGKLKNNPVEYDTKDLPLPELNEPEESALWQVLDELKSLNSNVGKLKIEVMKTLK